MERFAQRIEERLEKRFADRRPARRPADQGTAIVIVSLIAAIPLLGIAAGTVGLAGVVVVCAALVLLNWVVRN